MPGRGAGVFVVWGLWAGCGALAWLCFGAHTLSPSPLPLGCCDGLDGVLFPLPCITEGAAAPAGRTPPCLEKSRTGFQKAELGRVPPPSKSHCPPTKPRPPQNPYFCRWATAGTGPPLPPRGRDPLSPPPGGG